MSCELCGSDGGVALWRDALCRVVRPAVEGYPGFLRVIVNRHVKEMTDLAEREQRFQDFAEIASDWFWEVDESLRFTWISPSGLMRQSTPGYGSPT